MKKYKQFFVIRYKFVIIIEKDIVKFYSNIYKIRTIVQNCFALTVDIRRRFAHARHRAYGCATPALRRSAMRFCVRALSLSCAEALCVFVCGRYHFLAPKRYAFLCAGVIPLCHWPLRMPPFASYVANCLGISFLFKRLAPFLRFVASLCLIERHFAHVPRLSV